MRAAAVWLVPLLVVGLAGCAGGDNDEEPPDPTEPAPIEAAPEWELGMYWTYDNPFGPPLTVVVAEDLGTDWRLLTDSIDTARFDSQDPISFLDRTRKSDLAGSQGDDRVRFFDWPLEDGKTWSTSWDDVTRQITAVRSNDGTWDLEAREGGFLAVEYNYDPEARWFRHLTFHDEDGGSASLDLVRSGESFQGTVYRFNVDDPIRAFASGATGSATSQFEVDAETTELGVTMTRVCGDSGFMRASLAPPMEDGSAQPAPPVPPLGEAAYLDEADCPGDGDHSETLILESVPGTWRADIMFFSPGASSELQITPRTLVSIEL